MTDIRSLYGEQYKSEHAVLLVNLGSPASCQVPDVKAYLTEFLMDERVISIPHFWRTLLVKGMIVPRRSPHTAKLYRKIWDEEDQTFPLVKHSADLALALSLEMQCPVALAMRYGAPLMDDALNALSQLEGIKTVTIVPLYPQYTRSTYETASVYALERSVALQVRYKMQVLPPFYAEPEYRSALAESIRPYLSQDYDRLLISLHGIPLSHLSKYCSGENGRTDYCVHRGHNPVDEVSCYRLHCESTAQFLAEDLSLPPERLEVAYQSRLGNQEWLKPYLADRIKALPNEGIQKILAVCPGFICDCLETIHEVDDEYHQLFLASGGKSFTYIPCLNSSTAIVQALSAIIYRKMNLPKLSTTSI